MVIFMAEFKLTTGHVIEVDEELIPFLSQYNWHGKADPRGRVYACRWQRGYRVYMHREVLIVSGVKPPHPAYKVVDHINNNSLVNTKSNLRWATKKQNRRNR